MIEEMIDRELDQVTAGLGKLDQCRPCVRFSYTVPTPSIRFELDGNCIVIFSRFDFK